MPKSRKQPAGVASPWSTGSGGPTFETKVGAYFMAAMLTEDRVFAPRLPFLVTGIDWQTRDKGWLLEDLLLHLRDGTEEGFLALSTKSNHQINREGFAEDFVRAIWRHWLQKDTAVFDKTKDFLGLALGRFDTRIEDAWNDLYSQAIHASDDPARLAWRHSGTQRSTGKLARQLFESLHCPPDLGNPNPAETVRLIGRLIVLHLDLRNAVSGSAQQALRLCQEAVEENDPKTARNLWARLCALASEHNSSGGSLRTLLPALRADFRLLASLDGRADWKRLDRFSQVGLERTRISLNSGLEIPRPEARREIEAQLRERRSVFVSGESGAGKSALAKSISTDWQSGSVVWLDPVGAQAEDLIALERKIGLRKSLVDLLPLSPRKLSLLVLDALERWSPGGFDCAARLIKTYSQSEAWVILATVRSDQQSRVFEELSSREALTGDWLPYPLALPSLKDLLEVWRRFPDLYRLLVRHPGMDGILRNLKVLDWLTLGRTSETAAWSTPSQLIDGLWERWRGSGPRRYGRGNVLRKIARLEAEQMEASVELSSLEGAENSLKELEDEELIRIEGERVSFRHDLTGDWARLRGLVEKSPEALRLELPNLARSPQWHSAIRLFGQRLIEKGDSGVQEWLELYESLPGDVDSSIVARDRLLDSLIFASSSEQFLERLWPRLIAHEGHLLDRLLLRFLFVATRPHRKVPAWRLPYWPLWGPILESLDRHRNDVATKAPERGAEICFLWLQSVPRDSDWRAEAARIALAIAKAHGSEKAFEAALCAAPELREEVADLALRLARRGKPSPTSEEPEDDPAVNQESLDFLHPWAGRRRPPYPDGPHERIGRGFREAVLNSQSLEGLITVRPETAREVLLACCLQEPRQVSLNRDQYPGDVPGLYEWLEGFPPAASKGPFLRFLELQPEEGLEAILRLVNQATANWEAESKTKRPRGSLVINRRRWVGNEEVYRWNEHSPNVLRSALMALEKWLEDELDQGRSVELALSRLFKCSRSAAFANVLVGLGKKRPELFEGPLLPLLGNWRLYRWDHFTGLLWLAIQLSLSHQFEGAFAAFRHAWEKKLRSADFAARDDIQRLIAWLDPVNYPDRTAASFQWPVPLRESSARGQATVLPAIIASNLAYKSHRLLKAAQALELQQAEELWSELLWVGSTKEHLRAEQYADAMTGAIAALLLLPGEWARDHSEQRSECKRLFFEILAESPSTDYIGHSAELIKEHWPGFAAETAVALLAEEPSDRRARHLTAMAVMGRWDRAETTGIAMIRGFHERHRLGEDWGRMQNLAVLWAALNSMGHHLDPQGDTWPHRWAPRLAGWFVEARIPSRSLDWKKIAEGSRLLRTRFHRKEAATLEDEFAPPWFRPVDLTTSDFNLNDLKAAFCWLPNWEPASTEREEWLELHRRLVEIARGPFLAVAQVTSNEHPHEGLISDYASWVLRRVAALVPRLTTPAERRSFWEPLFNLGEVGHDLAASFLRAWFDYGPPASESPDHFVRFWEEILHYAASEAQGSVGDTGWNLLMGLYWRGPATYGPIVGRLLPFYKDWAERLLTGGQTAKQFALFLGTPAASYLAPSGIAWLAAALPSFRDSRENSLDEAIIDLLRTVGKRATSDPALRTPFQGILAWVVQRATPAALTFQEEIRG